MPAILLFARSLSLAKIPVRVMKTYVGERRTSQFSRIKQRPPATDLSGPNASAESLTPRRSNLAVANAVDFQFDFFSSVAAFVSAAPVLSEGAIRHSGRGKNDHVLSGPPLGRSEGEDGDGTPQLIPLPNTISPRRECFWVTSFLPTPASPLRDSSWPSPTVIGSG